MLEIWLAWHQWLDRWLAMILPSKKGRTAASLNYPLTQAGSQVTLESVARENN
jgi:hypothetical protein